MYNQSYLSIHKASTRQKVLLYWVMLQSLSHWVSEILSCVSSSVTFLWHCPILHFAYHPQFQGNPGFCSCVFLTSRIHRRRPFTSWLVYHTKLWLWFSLQELGWVYIQHSTLPSTTLGQDLPFTISYTQSDMVENVSHVHMTGKTVMVHICKKIRHKKNGSFGSHHCIWLACNMIICIHS